MDKLNEIKIFIITERNYMKIKNSIRIINFTGLTYVTKTLRCTPFLNCNECDDIKDELIKRFRENHNINIKAEKRTGLNGKYNYNLSTWLKK